MKAIGNIEAEQVVLGTLIGDPKSAHFVGMLHIDDFGARPHRLIFEAFEIAAGEGRHASAVVLTPQFRGQKVGDISMTEYLSRIMSMMTRRECMSDYIRALKDMSGRRVLAEMSIRMTEVSNSASASLPEFLDHLTDTCDGIMSGLRRQQITSYSAYELGQGTIEKLKRKEKSHLIPTGLSTLDGALGGFGRGELNIIAGRPGMGKTTFAISAMRQAARKGVSSMFFSMEMGADPVAARLLSDAVFNSQTPIPYSKIIRHEVADWDIERLEEANQHMADLPIKIDYQSALTVSDISVRARRRADELASAGQRLDTIWIDHLGYMRSSDRYRGNKVYETGEMTKSLRALAKELGVSIQLLCQLSRSVENREDKRPQSSDARDSGNIEEDADCMLFPYREAHYLANLSYGDDTEKEMKRRAKLEMMENIMEIIATKTRNGGLFTRRLFTDIANNVVRDLA